MRKETINHQTDEVRKLFTFPTLSAQIMRERSCFFYLTSNHTASSCNWANFQEGSFAKIYINSQSFFSKTDQFFFQFPSRLVFYSTIIIHVWNLGINGNLYRLEKKGFWWWLNILFHLNTNNMKQKLKFIILKKGLKWSILIEVITPQKIRIIA